MDGRWFDERQLTAYIADGSEKFRKSNEKTVDVVEGEEEEEGEGDRLDKFGSWLEEEKR
jgi:HIV Tat-specific factor 1